LRQVKVIYMLIFIYVWLNETKIDSMYKIISIKINSRHGRTKKSVANIHIDD
jgi:hypothetical protein